jgi:GntR family transcriptional regulator
MTDNSATRRAFMERARQAAVERQTSPRRIHMLMRAGIRMGLVEPEQHLIEADMIHAFGASRNAVRDAMTLLANDGLVTRVRGAGTVVVGTISKISAFDGQAADESGNDFAAISTETAARYAIATTDERTVPSTGLLRSRLETTDTELRMTEHLISLDRVPFCVFTAYSLLAFPARSASVREGGLKGSFFEAFGIELGRIDTSIEAIASDSKTSEMLRLPVGAPVLCRERLLFDRDMTPRETSFTYYAGRDVALQSSTMVEPTS